MEEFKLESKKSTVGLLIKIVIFSLLVIRLFRLIEKVIGESSLIKWCLIFIIIAYLIYSYLTDKNILTIKDKKIISESSTGFPKKRKLKNSILMKSLK